jgi:transcriptional regulator with XRE-family HTH domain
MSEPSKLGRLLKACRLARGLTQREAAQRAGMHQSHVAEIESGAIPDPRFTSVKKLLNALDYELEVKAVSRK